MPNLPSIKTIQRTGCSKETATLIRKVLDGRLSPRDASPACDKWVRSCYNEPSYHEQQLAAINELLGCHGTEALRDTEDEDYYDNGVSFCPKYSYVNTGDTYATTILRDHKNGRWIVASYGDVVECEGL